MYQIIICILLFFFVGSRLWGRGVSGCNFLRPCLDSQLGQVLSIRATITFGLRSPSISTILLCPVLWLLLGGLRIRPPPHYWGAAVS